MGFGIKFQRRTGFRLRPEVWFGSGFKSISGVGGWDRCCSGGAVAFRFAVKLLMLFAFGPVVKRLVLNSAHKKTALIEAKRFLGFGCYQAK